MLINRRKHIKSKLSVSPHPDRVHFKPRNYAVPEVNDRPAPSSHTCHFSQSSWARATSSTQGGFPNAQRAEVTKALRNPAPKPSRHPANSSTRITLCRIGNVLLHSSLQFVWPSIIFVSIRLQTYTKIFSSRCVILWTLISCTHLIFRHPSLL